MPRVHRYTGPEYIDPKTVKRYPNWVYALDEEGRPGQDETTIKPAEIQTRIPEFGVCLTVADAVFADGSTAVALVGGDGSWDGTVERIDEVRLLEGKGQMLVNTFVGRARPHDNKRFFAEKRKSCRCARRGQL